jgi:hypothetical protein
MALDGGVDHGAPASAAEAPASSLDANEVEAELEGEPVGAAAAAGAGAGSGAAALGDARVHAAIVASAPRNANTSAVVVLSRTGVALKAKRCLGH